MAGSPETPLWHIVPQRRFPSGMTGKSSGVFRFRLEEERSRATTRDTPPCRFRVEGGAPGVGVTGVGVRGRAGRQLYKNNGASTRVIVARSLMRTWREGPAVSLKGSPTVSPTMAALWASERLPPYWPVSMYFLALSQAPPPLFISMAMRMP